MTKTDLKHTSNIPRKYAIFDLDGTILNTLPDLVAATNYVLTTFSYPLRTQEEIRLFIGDGIEKLLERSFGFPLSFDMLQNAVNVFKTYYDKHNSDFAFPYPHILDLLAFLKADDWTIAVISNKYQQSTTFLCHHFFEGLIDIAIGSRQNIPPKPNRSIFECFLTENSIPLNSLLVFVGDSPSDKTFSDNCGMNFCGVSWGFRNMDELTKSNTSPVFHSVNELQTEIYRISKQFFD